MNIDKLYERLETKLFKKSIGPGSAIIDIGANHGYYTVIGSRIVGRDGVIYAFEPDRRNYKTLVSNLAERECSYNVYAFKKAGWDENCTKEFFLNHDRDGDHKLWNDGVHSEMVWVDCVKLDTLFAYAKVDFIKSDTQGAEVQVFRGLEKTIKNNEKLKILFEYYPIALRGMGNEPIELLEIMEGHGIRLFFINNKGKRIEPIKSIHEFNEEYKDTESGHINLFGIKGDCSWL